MQNHGTPKGVTESKATARQRVGQKVKPLNAKEYDGKQIIERQKVEPKIKLLKAKEWDRQQTHRTPKGGTESKATEP